MKRASIGLPVVLFAGTFGLFASTLATKVLFGDPGEYTFVPHILGVVHPPGYAFYTLLAKAWQTLVPVGTVAYRTHLLSAAAGALVVTLVYGAVRQLTPPTWKGLRAYLPGVSAALSLAVAPDLWQHASHANAHIITAALAALGTFLLLRWDRSDDVRYLYAFAFVAGLAPTHHALLVFSYPAWGTFLLARRPRIWLMRWRALALCFAAGMFPWLYFPLRSAAGSIPFGPTEMHTLDGFLNLVLARGLTVNLFHFGLGEQGMRALVFLTLLALQFSALQIVLAVLGLGHLARQRRRAALLMGVFLAVNVAFIINTVQDVMAYLMVPFVGIAILGGAGVVALLERLPARRMLHTVPLLCALLILPPGVRAAKLWPKVNLNDDTAAAGYAEAIYARFAGKRAGAVLLADWEHLTPLWYSIYVEGRALPPEDVTLVYVTAGANPWVDGAWAHYETGPLYATGYRRALVDAGFRLRPIAGDLYRVLLPRDAQGVPDMQSPIYEMAGPVEFLGYDLPETHAAPGDIVPLVLYMRAADAPLESIIFPYAELGALDYGFTTDSHRLTLWWEAGEVVGERFDVRLPPDMAPGVYPLRLGLRNLNTGEDLGTWALGEVHIAGVPIYRPPPLLVDVGHRAGLEAAYLALPAVGQAAPWREPVLVRPGEAIDITLTWRALAPPEASYTVFIHLMDAGNAVWAQHDYTPLGGAFPTHLWFPKWLPGQAVYDPYRLRVPEDAPPGDYFIEVGMYGMTSLRRLPQFNVEGDLVGDRYILGPVRVVAP